MTRWLWITAVLALPPAWAETIYRYLDDKGGVTYTNIPSSAPRRGVEKIDIPSPSPSTVAPGSPKPGPAPSSRVRTPSPADFPKVDRDTQRKRDNSRRQILEDELDTEEQLLTDAKKAVSTGEAVRLGDEKNYQKYLDRIQKLKDTVTLHEKNVDALKKEISALR
jgi:hypothetical protein